MRVLFVWVFRFTISVDCFMTKFLGSYFGLCLLRGRWKNRTSPSVKVVFRNWTIFWILPIRHFRRCWWTFVNGRIFRLFIVCPWIGILWLMIIMGFRWDCGALLFKYRFIGLRGYRLRQGEGLSRPLAFWRWSTFLWTQH